MAEFYESAFGFRRIASGEGAVDLVPGGGDIALSDDGRQATVKATRESAHITSAGTGGPLNSTISAQSRSASAIRM